MFARRHSGLRQIGAWRSAAVHGCGWARRCMGVWRGATSGGTDFIAIFFSERKGIDTWNYIFIGNVAILVIAGLLFGWEKSLYSIIFQFTSTHLGINKLTAI